MTNRISRFFKDDKAGMARPAPEFGPNLSSHFAIVPCPGGAAGWSPLHQAAYEAARQQVWDTFLKKLFERLR